VTVLARNGELAEAATKALMVGGRAQFGAICAAMGVADALLITTSGELVTTPGMAARLRRDNGQMPVLDWPGTESGDL
jgi:thiamine biosynthesis lipoprotein ApbE